MLEVTDDSGFLALVVPATYYGFVASNWTFDQIVSRFKEQMQRRNLLIWATGLEGFWRVDVVLDKINIKGFMEVSGPLTIVGGSLLVTSYESLTMVAQFEDVKLPEKHEEDQLVGLPDGEYSCRIIQMFDPKNEECANAGSPDFVIEMTKPEVMPAVWESIPWLDKDVYGFTV